MAVVGSQENPTRTPGEEVLEGGETNLFVDEVGEGFGKLIELLLYLHYTHTVLESCVHLLHLKAVS